MVILHILDNLPDYLAISVVICGTAAGTRSAAFGSYYAGPGMSSGEPCIRRA
jgi:hypothetical protein